MSANIVARPVEYKGVNFRSSLEARYAILFDTLGLTWDYEPSIPLAGYIPDFLLRVALRRPAFSRPPATALVLIETKPIVCADDYASPVRKIALSGWEHAAAVLCPAPWSILDADGEHWAFGIATDRVERRDALPGGHASWHPVGIVAPVGACLASLVLGGGDDIRSAWRRAGNLVQWRPPVAKDSP